MRLIVFQKGFNYSQDGEGNRLVYHLQGCNMICPWCANPEGMAQSDSGTHSVHFTCEAYEMDTIIQEIKRSSLLFYDGGGVTLSGGEATLQFDAIRMLLREIKSLGIHTAIETNASHPKLQELFEVIDLLIMDFKHYDNEVHHKHTGVGNAVIKQNIERALTYHPRVLIRIPLIKGFNDLETDARSFVLFFKQFNTDHASFEFLPYHEYGAVKWEQCGRPYKMKDAHVSTQTVTLYKRIFEESKLSVIST